MGLDYNKTEFETSFGDVSQFNKTLDMEIVFSGRSNVGKSSLINKIFRRKNLARTSSKPGKTATINIYRTEKNVVFVDLPGYGYAKVSKTEKAKWDRLINGYFSSDKNIVLVNLLIDARHSPSRQDITMIEFLVETEIPFLIVLTKSDKLRPKEFEVRMENFKKEIPYYDDIKIIKTSAETGQGIEELKEIYDYITEYE